MKLSFSILALGFVLLSQTVAAQNSGSANHQKPLNNTPQKGYYAISNNVQKLASPSIVLTANSGVYPTVQKGYYSIGNNNRKLGQQILIQGSAVQPTVTAPKGYYSIPRNK